MCLHVNNFLSIASLRTFTFERNLIEHEIAFEFYITKETITAQATSIRIQEIWQGEKVTSVNNTTIILSYICFTVWSFFKMFQDIFLKHFHVDRKPPRISCNFPDSSCSVLFLFASKRNELLLNPKYILQWGHFSKTIELDWKLWCPMLESVLGTRYKSIALKI